MSDKKPVGRPPKGPPPPIPDTLQNVLASVVKTRTAAERAALDDD